MDKERKWNQEEGANDVPNAEFIFVSSHEGGSKQNGSFLILINIDKIGERLRTTLSGRVEQPRMSEQEDLLPGMHLSERVLNT